MKHTKTKNKYNKKRLLASLLVLLLVMSATLLFGGCAGGRVECICEDDCYGACNFELIVEVESLVLEATYSSWRGNYIVGYPPVIIATLTNLSGRRVNLHNRWFHRNILWVSFPTANYMAMHNRGMSRISLHRTSIGAGRYVSQSPYNNQSGFFRGEHEAIVSAHFYINYGSHNQQFIRLTYTFMFEVI